jgi:hypothetical protein
MIIVEIVVIIMKIVMIIVPVIAVYDAAGERADAEGADQQQQHPAETSFDSLGHLELLKKCE